MQPLESLVFYKVEHTESLHVTSSQEAKQHYQIHLS